VRFFEITILTVQLTNLSALRLPRARIFAGFEKKRRKNGKKEIKKGRNAARDSPNARRLSSAISLRISERIVRIVRDVDKGEPLSTVVECRCLTMP
jgi:hypothetical protein